jgi:RHS repeat-associated protein
MSLKIKGVKALYSLYYLGQIVSKQEILHDDTVNKYVYSYHPDRRWLTTVTINGSVIESYGYDANGNRTLYTNTELGINNKVPTYNIADQLTSDGHQYDVDGYLRQKTIGGVTTHYEYSSRGQLLSVQTPGKHVTYQHNAMGNRVAKFVDGAITEKYLWQDMTTLLAVYNPDNSLKQRFEYSLGNTPTSFTESGQKYYIVSDHLGSPRVITDSNGAVIKAYSYDAFGNRTTVTDNDPTLEIPFGFAGGLYDTDTGLNRFGFRDYDAETGRWTARDPIGLEDGPNIYTYVGNDPVGFVDPDGLLALNAAGFLIGGGIELGVQLLTNGFDFSAVDYVDVGTMALVGLVAPSSLLAGKSILNSTKAAKALNKQLGTAKAASKRAKLDRRAKAHSLSIKNHIKLQASIAALKYIIKKYLNQPESDEGQCN